MMRLRCLNLASESTTASPTPRVKTSPQKGRGLCHVIVFGVKPRSLNFANPLTIWLKIPPKTGVMSVTCPLFANATAIN